MHRLLILPLAALLCGWTWPDFAGSWKGAPPPQDCREPAIYNGVIIYGRRFAWTGSRLIATFSLRNDSPEPVIVNGVTPEGLVLTEFELVSPEGPTYYENWRATKGVFRREGFPPIAPMASAESTLQFTAQRLPYLLHFHRQVTRDGETKLKRSAFVCLVP
ncbi:MAG TPA: hypothetical protein VH684_30855 [Xanthobacteraceae bacterium]|jgi:hypothetical protein